MWKDVSSYSRSEKERVPNAWSLTKAGLRVSVHRHIHYKNGEWLLTCEPFYNLHVLASREQDEAKREALELVGEKARALAAAFTT